MPAELRDVKGGPVCVGPDGGSGRADRKSWHGRFVLPADPAPFDIRCARAVAVGVCPPTRKFHTMFPAMFLPVGPKGEAMVRRFISVWGEGVPKASTRSSVRPFTRPGAATAATDGESGDGESGEEGGDSAARGLRALGVMLERGLITRREYDERRAALGPARTDGGR